MNKKGIIVKETTDLFGKKGREFLKEVELSDIYREEIDTYLGLIDQLDAHIDIKEKKNRCC